MRAASIGLAGAVILTATLAAQRTTMREHPLPPVPAGTASISGMVVNDLTSRPLRRATVSIGAADDTASVAAVTDDTGAFAVSGLAAGRYLVSASRPGFVSVGYGAKRPNRPGPALALADGQAQTGLTLRLLPGGVLTGTVRTPAGEPVSAARVNVLHPSLAFDTGERTLISALAPNVTTDDRGAYRVYDLAPDEYYVMVTMGSLIRSTPELRQTSSAEVDWALRQLKGGVGLGPMPPPLVGQAVDYAPVFYPSAFSEASAAGVVLKEGEERGGIDIVVSMVPTAKITGTVVAPAGGTLPTPLTLNIIAHEPMPGVPFSGFSNGRVDPDGRFVSAGLSPGDYTVAVRVPSGRGGAAAAALFGLARVTVSGVDVDTTIQLETGATVSGKLAFEGTTPPPADLTKVRVSLTAVRGSLPTLGVGAPQMDPSGAFSIPGVTPGRYRLSAIGLSGWRVARATVGGHDALDGAVDIGTDDLTAELVFSDRSSEVSGHLLDAAGHPAPEYSIIIFPTDRAMWGPLSRRTQSVRPSTDGTYRVSLPPGEYLVAAVTDVELGEWFDPKFLTQLVSAATTLTLAEGEKKVQDLKLGGG